MTVRLGAALYADKRVRAHHDGHTPLLRVYRAQGLRREDFAVLARWAEDLRSR